MVWLRDRYQLCLRGTRLVAVVAAILAGCNPGGFAEVIGDGGGEGPEDEGKNTQRVVMGRGDPVGHVEGLPEGIDGAGPNVTEDHPQGCERESPEVSVRGIPLLSVHPRPHFSWFITERRNGPSSGAETRRSCFRGLPRGNIEAMRQRGLL